MSTVLGTAARPDSFVTPPYPVHRFTVAEYRRLVDSGVLAEDERLELLEGWIVPKVTHNPPHDWTVTEIGELLSPLVSSDWLVRSQCAINTRDSEPEPDNVVVRRPSSRYVQQHPRGRDIGLVIEVAESSLAKDRRKAAIYAADGIPVYWIINLVDRQIEVHSDPDAGNRIFRNQHIAMPGESVDVVLDGRSLGQLNVDDLLPPIDSEN